MAEPSEKKVDREARRLLADAYTVLRSADSAAYMRELSLDSMIAQEIARLGAPPERQLDGSQNAADPPVGAYSERTRLVRLREGVKASLQAIRDLA